MTRTGITRRTLFIAIGLVVAAQAATVFMVYRMTARAPARSGAATTSQDGARPRAPAEMPHLAMPPRSDTAAPQAAGASMPKPAPPAWAARPLDEAGTQLADDLHASGDDLKLLADADGRISPRTRAGLMAGRDLAYEIADQTGFRARADELSSIVVGFMVHRVTLRESFRGSSVTLEAIDASARNDALSMAEANFDLRTRQALEAALSRLPDLTATP